MPRPWRLDRVAGELLQLWMGPLCSSVLVQVLQLRDSGGGIYKRWMGICFPKRLSSCCGPLTCHLNTVRERKTRKDPWQLAGPNWMCLPRWHQQVKPAKLSAVLGSLPHLRPHLLHHTHSILCEDMLSVHQAQQLRSGWVVDYCSGHRQASILLW